MKPMLVFFLSLSIVSFQACSQSYDTNIPNSNHSGNIVHYIYSGERVFLDTTWHELISPDSILVYYYNIKGKYPESSETIKEKASLFLRNTGRVYTGSGYITFRFFIDSTGHMLQRIQLFQTDEFYRNYTFNEYLVSDLFDFLKTMRRWKPAPAFTAIPRYYINLVSFKIHEGKLVDIIP